MNKTSKSIIFLVFLTAGIAGLININLGARRRFGPHGHHRPIGPYRRPLRRGLWFGTRHPGVYQVFGPTHYYRPYSKYSWQDSQGEIFWDISNNSNETIWVQNRGNKLRIKPGHRVKLSRDGSFIIEVETESGQKESFETDNHFVTFYHDSENNIEMRSYIDWPGN